MKLPPQTYKKPPIVQLEWPILPLFKSGNYIQVSVTRSILNALKPYYSVKGKPPPVIKTYRFAKLHTELPVFWSLSRK